MWIIPELGPNETRQQSKLDRFFDHQTKAQALVRESIQNSLDAVKNKNKPARISFSFDKIKSNKFQEYLKGKNNNLEKHLNSCGLDLSTESYTCLIIEDFNTEGLTGPIDNMSYEDDKTPSSGNFIGFWWSEGISDKRIGSAGSHGVGKITLSTSSDINTFFGYTKRNDDKKELLIGYSQLKYHSFNKKQFKGYGRYGKKDSNGRIWPYSNEEDQVIIQQFRNDFNLKRTNNTGLSITIPAVDNDINFEAVIESTIKEFYVPLMRGELEVEITDSIRIEEVTAENIASISKKYLNKKKDKELIICAQEMLEILDSGMKYPKVGTELGKVRKRKILTKDFFDGDIEQMQHKFTSGDMVGVKIPIEIKKENSSDGNVITKTSYFHIFIKNDEGLKLKRSTNYIRDKLLINKEGGSVTKPFTIAFVYITDQDLSEFLKYAEDPGHERWVYRTLYENGNVNKENDTPLRLIKSSIGSFYNILAGIEEERTIKNVLPEIFSIPEKKTGGKKGKTSPTPDVNPQRSKKSPFVLSRISGGFRVKQSKNLKNLLESEELDLPFKIKISTGYFRIRGGGISKYKLLDFNLAETEQFKVINNNTTIISRRKNILEAKVTRKKFSLETKGFDQNRDLEIRCQLIEN